MIEAKTPAGSLPPFITVQGADLLLAVKVQPRAARSEIMGAHGPELRIRVTAPPVDAAANEALLRLMAEWLDCPRRAVELVRGQTSRHKLVKIYGLPARTVCDRLKLM